LTADEKGSRPFLTASAQEGVEILKQLVRDCGIPPRLRDLNIPENALERMAKSALTVQRLLVRNLREVTLQDALDIYRKAF
jgi:alcohol dehydrogenase class IV